MLAMMMRVVFLVMLLSSLPGNAATQPQWRTPVVEGPQISYHTFISESADAEVSYHLYTPKVYAEDPQRRFPVVYWLHGSGGGVQGISLLSKHVDAAIDAGQVPPFLVVFVNGLRLGMYVDWKNGSAPIESVIIKDLSLISTLPIVRSRIAKVACSMVSAWVATALRDSDLNIQSFLGRSRLWGVAPYKKH